MICSIFYWGKDIRAVENPYDAAFELADRIKKQSPFIIIELVLLTFITTLNIAAIMQGIEYPRRTMLSEPLTLASIFLAGLVIIFIVILVVRLVSSIRFIVDFRRQHGLMTEISKPFDPSALSGKKSSKTVVKESPQEGLIRLIRDASEHSHTINKTFFIIVLYFVLMTLAFLTFLLVQYIFFGGIELKIGPEGQKGDIFPPFMIFLEIALVLLLFFQFRFMKNRYRSIEYSLNHKSPAIPQGKDPISRFKKYLSKKKGYGHLKNDISWKKDDYFDSTAQGRSGQILIKGLDAPPTMKDIDMFRRMCEKKGGLDRVIILYKEGRNAINGKVYDSIIKEPLIRGCYACNIQLVEESNDRTYDLIPVMSF